MAGPKTGYPGLGGRRPAVQWAAKMHDIAKRRAQVSSLRILGKTIYEIAEELGVSKSTIQSDLDALHEEWHHERILNTDRVKALELRRLDEATMLAIEMIRAKELSAIDRLVKVTEQRSKLLGLNSPERHEVVGDLSPTAVAARVKEIFGKVDREIDDEE